MGFTTAEALKLTFKVQAGGVIDAASGAQWYESKFPFNPSINASRVLTQFEQVKLYPAANGASASAASLALPSIIENRSSTGTFSSLRLTQVVSGGNNTWVAYDIYNDRSSSVLDLWIQPQKVPRPNGDPSIGYSISLYSGNPSSGGVLITTTLGQSGGEVGWVFNYDMGMLFLANDLITTISGAPGTYPAGLDFYIRGFRYIGETLANATFTGGSASFSNSTTIGFTQSGPTYSFFVNNASLTASQLNTGTNGGATAGYVLSVDSNGDFAWIADVNGINGTDGTSGTEGTSGTSGNDGINGTDGTSGTEGTSGTSGNDGMNGTDGTSGTSGTSGISGVNGVDGTDGTSGTEGTSGTSGTDGTSGTEGTSGTSGNDGINGTDGTSGTEGTSGTSGTDGINGTDGTSGTEGTSGTSGNDGINGTDGTSGTEGTSGTSGNDGINGTDGTSGTEGTSGTSGNDGINGTDGTSGTEGTSGTSTAVITDPNAGIAITYGSTNSVIDTIYNTALDPSLVMPYSVGGIAYGTTAGALSSMNLVQLFDDLLFPTVSPTYTIPTIGLSSTITGAKEVGETISPAITLTGTENDANYFSQLVIKKSINSGALSTLLTVSATSSMTITSATSIPPQFGYTDPNNPNYSYAVSTTDSGLVVPAPASGGSSTVVYSGLGDYEAGLAKKNNKGVTHSASAAVRTTTAPQAASTNFAPSTQTITGYYPYFYGKTSTQKTAAEIVTIIQSGTTGYTKVVNAGSGSLSMAFGASGEWPWFAVYSFYSPKSTWVETAFPLNNGNIGLVPTDLFAAPTTLTITSPDGYWIVGYKIYPANKITTIGTATIS